MNGGVYVELERVVQGLAGVRGVLAVGLGGSRAGGTNGVGSDWDLGVYYEGDGLDVEALGAAMTALDDGHRAEVLNGPGAWGPWVNGGGWLTVDGEAVDVLLRDVGKVRAVVDDCVAGRITIDYQCGHPFGFLNVIYAGETHFAVPLWEGEERALSGLKARLGGYPAQMGRALVERFMWEGWFALEGTGKAARRGDLSYALGSVYRVVTSWAVVVHALNGVHWMNEKGALKRAAEMAVAPEGMEARVKGVFGMMAGGDVEGALKALVEMQDELRHLTKRYAVPEQKIR